jgi:hypothetical protein
LEWAELTEAGNEQSDKFRAAANPPFLRRPSCDLMLLVITQRLVFATDVYVLKVFETYIVNLELKDPNVRIKFGFLDTGGGPETDHLRHLCFCCLEPSYIGTWTEIGFPRHYTES